MSAKQGVGMTVMDGRSDGAFHNSQNENSHEVGSAIVSEQKKLLQDEQARNEGGIHADHGNSDNMTRESWTYECIACGIATAGLVALIAVLARFDHQISRELRQGITLNAVVAVLSTIIRTAAIASISGVLGQEKWLWFGHAHHGQVRRLEDLEVFDKATRGSWGSLLLLWRTKGLHMAAVGAVLTIASLAFGTLVQQALTTVYHQTPQSFNGTGIIRSDNFNSWNQVYGENTQIPTLAMQAAITVGLSAGLVSETIPQIQATCPTGNCTWPITPSLGFCGSCRAFEPIRACSGPTSTETCTDLTDSTCSDYSCAYKFPDGKNITDSPQRYLGNRTEYSSSLIFKSIPTSGGLYNDSNALYVANFNLVGGRYHPQFTFEANFGNGVNTTFSQCAIWACVQAHNISVSQGKQQSSISQSWSQPSYIVPGDDSDVPNFRKFVFLDNNQNSSTFNKMNLTISNATILAVKSYMDATLSAAVTTQPLGFFQLTPTGEALWNASMAPDIFIDSLALSMSNHIRSISSNSTNLFPAIVVADEALVKVRWGWIAFPVIIVAVLIIQLLVSMANTRRSGLGLWKNSSVVLLSTQLDIKILTLKHQSHGLAYTEIPVELKRKIDGWAFEAVEETV